MTYQDIDKESCTTLEISVLFEDGDTPGSVLTSALGLAKSKVRAVKLLDAEKKDSK